MTSDLVPQAVVSLLQQQHQHIQGVQRNMANSNNQNQGSTNGQVRGVVGHQPAGALDPIVGLRPDAFEGARTRAQQDLAKEQRSQLPGGSLLSPHRMPNPALTGSRKQRGNISHTNTNTNGNGNGNGHGNRGMRGSFGIGPAVTPSATMQSQSQPGVGVGVGNFSINSLRSEPVNGSGGGGGGNRNEGEDGPVALNDLSSSRNVAPALLGLLAFSKDYLLDCFDRYAVASKERIANVCEEDLEG